MYKSKNTKFDFTNIGDCFEDLLKVIEPIYKEKDYLKDVDFHDVFTGPVNYRYKENDGLVTIETVITGHNPDNVKVKYNKNTNTLKIVDECDVPEENRPWYYNELKLELQLPEHVEQKTFVKHIENGVLTVTVNYWVPEDEKVEDLEYNI
ncbi:MAG: Hsp20 family protein [Bacteroidales bacterium]|nr:Hsp20 family protein [Bacteroidales bacterium]